MKDVPSYRFEDGRPARHPWLVYVFAFNEGTKLADQLARMPTPEARGYDIMLGDDGSSDGSAPSSFIARFGLRGITRLERNLGLSPNIKAGMDWTLKQGYKGVVLMNGNGRDGVEGVPDFLKKLEEGYGYVQGSRFLSGGLHENTPGYRFWAIRLVHAPLFSLAAGKRFTDTTNGFRAFSTAALRAMGDGLFSPEFQKYEVEQYMAWKTVRLGLRSCEIPVARRYPADTKTQQFSKIRPGIGWWEMMKPLLMLLTRSYP
ncbi:MAG: glycosyltransferase family 2 protein [Elusimicrobia bacterium]|nr:glycosyltransferase family 2 protein [Elusimicrobiota bacterium]